MKEWTEYSIRIDAYHQSGLILEFQISIDKKVPAEGVLSSPCRLAKVNDLVEREPGCPGEDVLLASTAPSKSCPA